MKSIAIAAAIGLTALGFTPPADAAGCLKGAILGGIAGHYAGHHGLLGAGAGCVVGHELANRPARTQNGSSTIARDQYGRYRYDQNGAGGSSVLVRDQHGNLVNRYRDDTTGYGSSMPDRLR